MEFSVLFVLPRLFAGLLRNCSPHRTLRCRGCELNICFLKLVTCNSSFVGWFLFFFCLSSVRNLNCPIALAFLKTNLAGLTCWPFAFCLFAYFGFGLLGCVCVVFFFDCPLWPYFYIFVNNSIEFQFTRKNAKRGDATKVGGPLGSSVGLFSFLFFCFCIYILFKLYIISVAFPLCFVVLRWLADVPDLQLTWRGFYLSLGIYLILIKRNSLPDKNGPAPWPRPHERRTAQRSNEKEHLNKTEEWMAKSTAFTLSGQQNGAERSWHQLMPGRVALNTWMAFEDSSRIFQICPLDPLLIAITQLFRLCIFIILIGFSLHSAFSIRHSAAY